MANAHRAFAALSDGTRRQIFETLRTGGLSVGEIAHRFPVSRPAVSQHLKNLKVAGLVTDRAKGTRRVYRIDPDGLAAVRAWLDQFWEVALRGYAAEVKKSEKRR